MGELIILFIFGVLELMKFNSVYDAFSYNNISMLENIFDLTSSQINFVWNLWLTKFLRSPSLPEVGIESSWDFLRLWSYKLFLENIQGEKKIEFVNYVQL